MPPVTPTSPPSDFHASSLWSAFGVRARKNAAVDRSGPDTTRSSSGMRAGELDDIRSVFWQSFRHLFPPHAITTQNDNGALVISWSMSGDPHARFKYAAPVVLRFEPELLELMVSGTAEQRKRIASHQEANLRAGLVGYDPYAGSQARIIVLG